MAAIDNKLRSTVVSLGLLSVLCLVCDFLMVPVLRNLTGPPKMPGVPFALGIVGCALAQGNLLAAWMAWSDQPFWQRFTRHWIIAAVLYFSWVAGLALGKPDQFAELSSFVGLSVPLLSLAAQLPLWIVRQLFGWRLVRGDVKDDSGWTPLSIRHLMWATIIVAVTLALARLAPSPDKKDVGALWIVMFVLASGISTLTLLPAAPMALRSKSFRSGSLFAILYAAFWVGLLWIFILVVLYKGLFIPPPLAGACQLLRVPRISGKGQ